MMFGEIRQLTIRELTASIVITIISFLIVTCLMSQFYFVLLWAICGDAADCGDPNQLITRAVTGFIFIFVPAIVSIVPASIIMSLRHKSVFGAFSVVMLLFGIVLYLLSAVVGKTIVPVPLSIYFTTKYVVSPISNFKLNQYYVQLSKGVRQQKYETIKRGKITQEGSTLIYECTVCGYKIKFPSSWGFKESNSLQDFYYAGAGQVFTLITSDYLESINHPKGGAFDIESFDSSNYFSMLASYLDISSKANNPWMRKQVTINSITANVAKETIQFKRMFTSQYAWFQLGTHYYIIRSRVADVNEYEKYLSNILTNFELTD